jgi:hypothetical protein
VGLGAFPAEVIAVGVATAQQARFDRSETNGNWGKKTVKIVENDTSYPMAFAIALTAIRQVRSTYPRGGNNNN